jgi:uncharacterized protein (DUF58 family)
MFHQLKQTFFPSKGWAIFGAIVCFALAIFAIAVAGQWWYMFAPTLFMFALWYGGIWYYRHNRDVKITRQAQAIQQQPPIEAPVTKMDPDSYRLIVPPQHDM